MPPSLRKVVAAAIGGGAIAIASVLITGPSGNVDLPLYFQTPVIT